MNRHNPKEKRKLIINKKNKENTYANRTHGYEMTINNNKENLKQESCRLPQIGQ
jgi:hypothetical protein